MAKQFKPETLCVQAGWTPKKGEPRVLPIYQSTTFKYDTSEQMARLFDLEDSGYFYTRLQNPTNDAVAAKIAALEGGVAAMLTSSGQAANFYAIFNICQAGDHFVCSSTIYGGTFNLFGVTLKKLGIDVTFVNPGCQRGRNFRCFPPQYQGPIRRNHLQPYARSARYREVCPHCPQPRRALDCGQHLPYPHQLPSV